MEATTILDRVEVYRDAAGRWRWRAISRNMVDVLADSGQGYVNHVDCRAIAEGLFPGARVKDDLVGG